MALSLSQVVCSHKLLKEDERLDDEVIWGLRADRMFHPHPV